MSTDLNTEHIQKVLRGISIPPQPQIMVDLHMEQAMPDPDMTAIANIISQDIGLSAAVLKLVNSAYFALPIKTTSINQAVMILGIESVSNIVNGLAIKRELSDSEIIGMQTFWDNAMDVAAICSSLARQIDFKHSDACYSLGLFHNAGIPLLMERFDNYLEVLQEAYQSPDFDLTNLENESFQTNHSVVGYYLAKSWGVPKTSCYVIANHHRVEKLFTNRIPGDKTTLTFMSLLKMSEHIAKSYQHLGKAAEDYEWQQIGHHALEHLELTEYEFENLVATCHEQGLGN
ncbi:HDOD domain-containing protein [Marinomonas transparens]|uniref:HDOD domain-containing protein n=1 Tax=Marinomonas transparens TaxID=2795388 RepID=A0A934JQN0_9GAMM|nr:HDOD domain-containing protein [Marinomonas transparens]MBJ7538903.1 HDOD domain-containing protein [Marinomonas transparens]